MNDPEPAWTPDACTLPTTERPVRVAEFDELFRRALRRQQRLAPTTLRWELDPAAEELARELTGRETECCSFFEFTFDTGPDALLVSVRVPPAHIEVLDALENRAR